MPLTFLVFSVFFSPFCYLKLEWTSEIIVFFDLSPDLSVGTSYPFPFQLSLWAPVRALEVVPFHRHARSFSFLIILVWVNGIFLVHLLVEWSCTGRGKCKGSFFSFFHSKVLSCYRIGSTMSLQYSVSGLSPACSPHFISFTPAGCLPCTFSQICSFSIRWSFPPSGAWIP